MLAAAGGVGLAAVEVGRALGAHVVAAAGSAEKLEIARQHGAHELIDYSREPLRAKVRPDVVFDPVGGELGEAALRSLAHGGRHVVIGFASGAPPRVEPNILLVKNLSLLGFNFGAYIGWSPVDEREKHEARVRAVFTQLFDWHAQGRIRPLAAQVAPLEDFAATLDAMLARRTVGKAVLRIPQS